MDEKWKLPKKESSSSSSKFSFTRSSSTRSACPNAPLLSRSYSQKNVSSSSTNSKSSSSHLPRSYSQKVSSSSSSSSSSIGRKCSSIAKEQKARFYIMRRCVAMLVCWHKHGKE